MIFVITNKKETKAFSMKTSYLIVTKGLQFRPVFIAFVAMEPPGDRGSEV